MYSSKNEICPEGNCNEREETQIKREMTMISHRDCWLKQREILAVELYE